MKYVIANWKMNLEEQEIEAWIDFFAVDNRDLKDVEVIIAPSYPYLGKIKYFKVAAQDVSAFETGAHTEEVSAEQLKDFCEYCLVGHSEVGDNTQTKKLKIAQCLKHSITPIVCFESPEEANELMAEGVFLAWEDKANISGGKDYKDINLSSVKSTITKLRETIPYQIPILYGGSVNRQNVEELVKIGIEGVLVGQASNDPVHFAELVRAFE